MCNSSALTTSSDLIFFLIVKVCDSLVILSFSTALFYSIISFAKGMMGKVLKEALSAKTTNYIT